MDDLCVGDVVIAVHDLDVGRARLIDDVGNRPSGVVYHLDGFPWGHWHHGDELTLKSRAPAPVDSTKYLAKDIRKILDQQGEMLVLMKAMQERIG